MGNTVSSSLNASNLDSKWLFLMTNHLSPLTSKYQNIYFYFIVAFLKTWLAFLCGARLLRGLVCLFIYTCLLLSFTSFVDPGSSVPSAFLLWVMREVPPVAPANVQEESTTLTFISDSSVAIQNPQRWITVASVSNQVCRFSSYVKLV